MFGVVLHRNNSSKSFWFHVSFSSACENNNSMAAEYATPILKFAAQIFSGKAAIMNQ